MTRYRWFNASWPQNMRALSNRLKSKMFVDDSREGFVIDKVRDDFVEARFIERIEFTDVVVDPFGSELTCERVSFNHCEFRVSSDRPGLELLNAPRNTQKLVANLIQMNDFEVSIESLSIDVLDWFHRFQNNVDVDVNVDSIQIGSFEISEGISVKAAVKGNRDVRDAVSKLTHGRPYEIEKIQLRLTGQYIGKVLLTNVGSAVIEVDHNESLLNSLRAS
ncbi:MAG: hypothetical protein EOP04_17805, partial [Proteobacteria bacterium]